MRRKTFSLIFISAVCSIFILSCEKKSESPTDLFEDKVNVNGSILNTGSLKLNVPLQMLVFDSLLILHDNFEVGDKKYFFALLNRYTGKVEKYYGREGKGPNEFLFPCYLSRIPNKKNYIGINNRRLFSFSYIPIEQITTKTSPSKIITTNEFDINLSVIVKINEKRYLGTGFFDNGRYAIINEGGEILNIFLDYPFQKHFDDIPLKSLGMAFQSNLAVHPKKPIVASATSSSANLDILEFRNDSLILINSIHSDHTLFENNSTNTRLSVNILPENKRGFQDIDVSEYNIYELYSGIKRKEGLRKYRSGKKLLVFNWKGEPIKQLNLDTALYKISVDPKDETLYGLFINQNNQYLIKKYSLNL